MPHLLSLYAAVNDHWQETFCTGHESKQLHSLDTVTNTEYGEVVQGGVYDVDDYCKIKFQRNGRSWKLEANWADLKEDNRSVEFKLTDGTVECFDLGLCPEYAYANMIADAVENQDNPSWWSRQLSLDLWIHSVMEKLSCE